MATKRVQILDTNGNSTTIEIPAIWATSSAAPAVTDDSGDGFDVGSIWLRVTGGNPTFYVCTDPTAGAAVWALLPALADQVLTTDFVNNFSTLRADVAGTPTELVSAAQSVNVRAGAGIVNLPLGVNTVLGRVAGDLKALTQAEQRSNILTTSQAETNLLIGVNTLNETRNRTKTATALADADAAPLTGAQTVGGLLTIAASAPRTLTMDSTAAIVAALAGAGTGTQFEFTLVNTGADSASLAMHANGTFVGHNSQLTVATHTSGTFLVHITGAATYHVYRK